MVGVTGLMGAAVGGRATGAGGVGASGSGTAGVSGSGGGASGASTTVTRRIWLATPPLPSDTMTSTS